MKYVKYSIFILLACFGLSVAGASAMQLGINGIKLPALSGNYKTKEMTRSSSMTGQQYIVKQKCTDIWSGDDRAVVASLHKTSSVAYSSEYLNLPKDTKVYYGTTSTVAGTYQVWLKATKPTVSTAYFEGYWHYGT